MKDDKQINLQTPYKIKSPICTKKHLNINITDTGKDNNRRWQAPGGQRGKRANSAGRFRHGCTRSYASRVNPSTAQGAAFADTIPAGRCGHRPLHVEKSSTCPQHLQSLKSKETATFFRKPASHNCSGIPLSGVSAHACSAASSDAYPYALTVSAMVMHARFFPA